MWCFPACKRRYVRPAGEHDLGDVDFLLHAQNYVPSRSILAFRDKDGWSALSTRCTRDGCDLTYQEDSLFCSCCSSKYDHRGVVISGPTEEALPWYSMRFKDYHLYAHSGKIVDENYRFTTPEIEDAIARLKVRVETEGVKPGVKIPEILLGSGGDKPTQQKFDPRVLDSIDNTRSELGEVGKKLDP